MLLPLVSKPLIAPFTFTLRATADEELVELELKSELDTDTALLDETARDVVDELATELAGVLLSELELRLGLSSLPPPPQAAKLRATSAALKRMSVNMVVLLVMKKILV
jgi:hypothetical protein